MKNKKEIVRRMNITASMTTEVIVQFLENWEKYKVRVGGHSQINVSLMFHRSINDSWYCRRHVDLFPTTENFEHPVASKRSTYNATDTDEIIGYLCNPNFNPPENDETFTMRLWTSYALYYCIQLRNTLPNWRTLLGIPESTISKRAQRVLTPKAFNFLAN